LIYGGYDTLFEEFFFAETVTQNGIWTIAVSGSDAAGNQTLVMYEFDLDTIAPDIDLSLGSVTYYGPISGPSGEYYEVYDQFVDMTAVISDAKTAPQHWAKYVNVDRTVGAVTNEAETRINTSHANPWATTFREILQGGELLSTYTFTAADRVGNVSSRQIAVRYVVATEDIIVAEGIVGPGGGTVEAEDGTKVLVAAGGLAWDTLISIRLVPEMDIPDYDVDDLPGVTGTPFARRFAPEDLVFLECGSISMPYNEGWISAYNAENTDDIDETKLGLFAWDGMRWQRVHSTVDEAANVVTTPCVNHLGIFRIMEDTRTAPWDFCVYLTNNPFSPNGDGHRDHTVFVFELPDHADHISLRVYDLAGDLVRVLMEQDDVPAGYHEATWTGQNDFGSYIGSGIHVFKLVVDYGDGSNTVIRPVGVIK
jgi:hypothetical protein